MVLSETPLSRNRYLDPVFHRFLSRSLRFWGELLSSGGQVVRLSCIGCTFFCFFFIFEHLMACGEGLGVL